jgi:hypothetical protein
VTYPNKIQRNIKLKEPAAATVKLTYTLKPGYGEPYRIQSAYFENCRNGDCSGKQDAPGGLRFNFAAWLCYYSIMKVSDTGK